MPPNEQYQVARDLIASSLGGFLPEIILSVAVCALFLHDLLTKGLNPRRSAAMAVVGLGLAGVALLFTWPEASTQLFGWKTGDAHQGMLVQDAFGWFFKMLVVLSTLIVVPMCLQHPPFQNRRMGEFYALLLGSCLGMFLMAGASNLLMIYLGIEFASMGSYLLTAFVKGDRKGSEAGLKYVIYGSVASGVMLFGLSLVYGMTGSLYIGEIAQELLVGNISQIGLITTGVLVFGGFAYKMAAFPMHFWCPDVYEGAPTPVTAWLSVASKAAGFAVFVRFLMSFSAGFNVDYRMTGGLLDSIGFGWRELVAVAATLSMTVGNMAALWQTNVKRMLAYSSVAHAGYLLMGVAVLDPSDTGGSQFAPLIFYFMAYFVMNLGAFYIVNLVSAKEGREDLAGYRHLGRRAPVMAFCLTLFLFSLIGLPPTGGFIGKLQLIGAVIKSDMVWLAVVAGVNTAISVYYYARLFKAMYLEDADETEPAPFVSAPGSLAFLGGFALLTLILGVAFNPIAELARTFSF